MGRAAEGGGNGTYEWTGGHVESTGPECAQDFAGRAWGRWETEYELVDVFLLQGIEDHLAESVFGANWT